RCATERRRKNCVAGRSWPWLRSNRKCCAVVPAQMRASRSPKMLVAWRASLHADARTKKRADKPSCKCDDESKKSNSYALKSKLKCAPRRTPSVGPKKKRGNAKRKQLVAELRKKLNGLPRKKFVAMPKQKLVSRLRRTRGTKRQKKLVDGLKTKCGDRPTKMRGCRLKNRLGYELRTKHDNAQNWKLEFARKSRRSCAPKKKSDTYPSMTI